MFCGFSTHFFRELGADFGQFIDFSLNLHIGARNQKIQEFTIFCSFFKIAKSFRFIEYNPHFDPRVVIFFLRLIFHDVVETCKLDTEVHLGKFVSLDFVVPWWSKNVDCRAFST